jgi:ribosomal-protein-alanine N-acetyltransferase
MSARLPARFETARLRLRCYAPGDGTWYYTMGCRNRSHLARYEAENPAVSIQSEQEAEALICQFAADWAAGAVFFLGAFEKTSGEFVAQIYVGPGNSTLPEFEIGYFADRDQEGRGFVSEAVSAVVRLLFDEAKAHRIHAECDDTNLRSVRVLERCGFVREGHLRENKRHADGTITGTLHFGLLRSEFEEGRGRHTTA